MGGLGGSKSLRLLIPVAPMILLSISLLGLPMGFENPRELELLLFMLKTLSHMRVVAREISSPMFLSLTPGHNPPPLLLGLVSSSGASLGKLTLYYAGRGIAPSAGGG